jgi:diacyltrehalose acyltransferase
MVNWRKHLVPTIAATSLLLASGTLANGISQAQEAEKVEKAILIPGAMPFKAINPIYPIVATSYPDIGIHFRDDQADWQLVTYSQNPFASDKALLDGVKQALPMVPTDGKVVIIGESMGSMVAARLAVELAANSPDPSKDDVSVVLIAPPEAGIAEYFKEGTFIPILNYQISRVPESPYPTTIVIGEYDGWADPPDRPWNLVSAGNALLGIAYVHGPPIFTAPVSDENKTTHTNGVGGVVTTYFVPTENLPLTQVFRDVGVPDALVDRADQVLRPVVDAGYVRHDQPGDPRPYLYDGGIHRNVQSQQQVREPLRAPSEKGLDIGQERREHRSELRQAIRKDLRDRVEAGFGQLKKRIAERRAERATPPE